MLNGARAADATAWFRARVRPAMFEQGFSVHATWPEKLFPREESAACYQVALAGAGRRCSGLTRITVQQCADPARRQRLLARLRHGATQLANRDPTVPICFGEVANDGLLFFSFPLDPKLPWLADATAPRLVSRALGEVGLATTNRPVTQVQVVRYVPLRRCQMRWTFTDGASNPRNVYAKAYRHTRGDELLRTMAQLHDWIRSARQADIATPKPLATIAAWHLLLQDAAPGPTLHAKIVSGQARPGDFERVGRALGLFHSAPLDPDHQHDLDSEISVARRWVGLALRHRTLPGLAALLGELEELGASADTVARPALLHRDCYDRQFLLDPSRVSIIDVDGVARGAPELDVANFLAHIHLRKVQGHLDLDAARLGARAFLAGYRQLATFQIDPGRLSIYRATACLRLAALYSLRSGDGGVARALADRASHELGQWRMAADSATSGAGHVW